MRGLVSTVQLPAPYNGLDVLPLTEFSLRDRLTLIKRHRVLTSKQAEAELRMAEVRPSEEQVRPAGEIRKRSAR